MKKIGLNGRDMKLDRAIDTVLWLILYSIIVSLLLGLAVLATMADDAASRPPVTVTATGAY